MDMFYGHLQRVMQTLVIPANDKGFMRQVLKAFAAKALYMASSVPVG